MSVDVRVGAYEDTTIAITNSGDDPLRISSIVSQSSDFLSRSNVADIPPSESLDDTLLFAPIANGPASSVILLMSNSAGSPNSLHLSGNGIVTSVKLSPGVPVSYSLSQNYPDPFNPSTVIRFGLPSRSIVRLTVYNALGQKVKELVDSELGAGYHEVVWRADVPSGVYFYRLDSVSTGNSGKDFTETRKMALIR